MKLTDLKPQSSQLTILHPITNEPLKTDGGVTVVLDVVGRDSQLFYNHQKGLLKNLTLNTKNDEVSPEQLTKMVTEQMAVCITGWDDKVNEFFAGFDTKAGKGKYSHKLCIKLMSDGELSWFKEQLDMFLDDRANFFKG